MKNIVAYQTAIKLKAAGFPQPDPEAGQIWYQTWNRNHPIIILRRFGGKNGLFYIGLDAGGEVVAFTDSTKTNCVFAPTAADIISELSKDTGDENPAEDAAKAWLVSRAAV